MISSGGSTQPRLTHFSVVPTIMYVMGKNEIANKAIQTVKTKASGVKESLTDLDMEQILDSCYAQAIDGIPKVSKPIDELTEDYAKKHDPGFYHV